MAWPLLGLLLISLWPIPACLSPPFHTTYLRCATPREAGHGQASRRVCPGSLCHVIHEGAQVLVTAGGLHTTDQGPVRLPSQPRLCPLPLLLTPAREAGPGHPASASWLCQVCAATRPVVDRLCCADWARLVLSTLLSQPSCRDHRPTAPNPTFKLGTESNLGLPRGPAHEAHVSMANPLPAGTVTDGYPFSTRVSRTWGGAVTSRPQTARASRPGVQPEALSAPSRGVASALSPRGC